MPLLALGIALLTAQQSALQKRYLTREDFRVVGSYSLVAKARCDSRVANDVALKLSIANCPTQVITQEGTCEFYASVDLHDRAVQMLKQEGAKRQIHLEIDPEPAPVGKGIRTSFRNGALFVSDDQFAVVRTALVSREPPIISPFISDSHPVRLTLHTSGTAENRVNSLTRESFFKAAIYTSDAAPWWYSSLRCDMDPRYHFARDSSRSFHCTDGYWDTKISFRSENGWLKISTIYTAVEAE